MNNIKMLYYDGIDVSEESDVNQTSESKKHDICYYQYFLDKGLKSQPDACNDCHDLLVLSVNLSNIAISKIQGADYCVIISGISKSEAANLPQADLNKNSTILEVVKIIKKV